MEMIDETKHGQFNGRLVMLGFGSIGQAVLPLLLRHFVITPEQITLITAHGLAATLAHDYCVELHAHALTAQNYAPLLDKYLKPGDFLLNLSVDVSSLALIAYCAKHDVLYLDTCIEPWADGYTDPGKSLSQRSNYALREAVLAFGRNNANGPTAIITQGANPGLASTFVKQALLNIASDTGVAIEQPLAHGDWAGLARRLDIKAIHIAERDTQSSPRRKKHDEFVNTWSVAGFISECVQPAELGWGSHERHWPDDAARHGYGCDAAIYLNRPGAATCVRSWTPHEGAYHGLLITHSESISIADHLTLRDKDQVIYRPTVHYAYHPCDDALLSLHELAGRNWRPQSKRHITRHEIKEGMDELGVLLMGNAKGAYWYGSCLTIDEARLLAPNNNATSLQVTAGILAGIAWALQNPEAGIVEPEDIDHEFVLRIARPYLGKVVGVYSDWTPLQDRNVLFNEELDRDDPWQFKNIRVI